MRPSPLGCVTGIPDYRKFVKFQLETFLSLWYTYVMEPGYYIVNDEDDGSTEIVTGPFWYLGEAVEHWIPEIGERVEAVDLPYLFVIREIFPNERP